MHSLVNEVIRKLRDDQLIVPEECEGKFSRKANPLLRLRASE
jgi:predicted nucleic acid-binding Zn ribbon protein